MGKKGVKEICDNTGRTHFKKGHPKPKNAYTFKKGHKVSKETREKISKAQRMEKGNNWKGGKTKTERGYILIKVPNHPFANNRGYVRRARLVMEKHLGRYLRPEEVVHHINNILTDDKIENLKLFSNNSKHISFHGLQK